MCADDRVRRGYECLSGSWEAIHLGRRSIIIAQRWFALLIVTLIAH